MGGKKFSKKGKKLELQSQLARDPHCWKLSSCVTMEQKNFKLLCDLPSIITKIKT